MKLSEKLKQIYDSGDCGEAIEGYAEKAKALEDALEKIAKWRREFPETGEFWSDVTAVSYRDANGGPDGERDYTRTVAGDALDKSAV